MKVTAKRDQFSGHWWIKVGDLSIEAYRAGRYDWTLWDIVYGGSGQIDHKQLDPKRNIVYPYFCGHAVPAFCSLRAMLTWVDDAFKIMR